MVKEKDLQGIYSFMRGVYPSNWQTRWGETPYMGHFTTQKELNWFVGRHGKFETVPGHVWGAILLWTNIRRVCPALNHVVDPLEVHEIISVHDLDETNAGDTSAVKKLYHGKDGDKEQGRQDLIKIVETLPEETRELFLRWHDEFEEREEINLEVRVAKWVEFLQGDHFALTYGKDLDRHSEIVEGVVKNRSARVARALINDLENRAEATQLKDFSQAAKEVGQVMKEHIEMIRSKGIQIDLSDLGF